MSNNDTCGYSDTHSGAPCQNPACEPDGRCWLHTQTDNQRGHRKLSHERQERIATAIEEGVPVVAACRLNGISYQIHREWMDHGEEQDEGPFAEYFERLARALGHDQRKKTQQMWDVALDEGDTDAMLTVLKQRYPETWGEVDLGERAGGPEINVHSKAPEDMDAIIDAINEDG